MLRQLEEAIGIGKQQRCLKDYASSCLLHGVSCIASVDTLHFSDKCVCVCTSKDTEKQNSLCLSVMVLMLHTQVRTRLRKDPLS